MSGGENERHRANFAIQIIANAFSRLVDSRARSSGHLALPQTVRAAALSKEESEIIFGPFERQCFLRIDHPEFKAKVQLCPYTLLQEIEGLQAFCVWVIGLTPKECFNDWLGLLVAASEQDGVDPFEIDSMVIEHRRA